MKNIILITISLAFLMCNDKAKAQMPTTVFKDSIMEKSIYRILSNKINVARDERLQSYSFVIVINYDSINKESGKVSIDTFWGSNFSQPSLVTYDYYLLPDTARYASIISKYHPSKALSIVIPILIYPMAYITKDSSTFLCKDISRFMFEYVDKIKKYYSLKRELYFAKPYLLEYSLPIR